MTLSSNTFIGGTLKLAQPAKGHRAGTDAVLLAAAVSPATNETLFDLGAGIGAAGLAVALRCRNTATYLVEIESAIAELARSNIAMNDLVEQVSVVEADITIPLARNPCLREAGLAHHVIMNPPFHIAGTVRAAPDMYRQRAHVHSAEHEAAWLSCAHDLLYPKGSLTVIHRADALPRLLPVLHRLFGDIRIIPVAPKADQAAIRILIRALKSTKAPLRLLPSLVLHREDGSFTPHADALHRGNALIDWLL